MDLKIINEDQPKRIIQFINRNKFQPEKYKFNITKDFNQLELKANAF